MFRFLVLLTSLSLITPNLCAGISGTSGAVNIITPPSSVFTDVLEDETHLSIFQEQSNFTLTAPVDVNAVTPGTYGGDDLATTSLGIGTVVNSYFVHFDQSSPAVRQISFASITFGSDILGIILQGTELDASVGQLGVIGTTYATGEAFHGLEALSHPFFDLISLLGDQRTITFDSWNAPTFPDQLRILTAPQTVVPEPGTYLILGTFLAFIALKRRSLKRLHEMKTQA